MNIMIKFIPDALMHQETTNRCLWWGFNFRPDSHPLITISSTCLPLFSFQWFVSTDSFNLTKRLNFYNSMPSASCLFSYLTYYKRESIKSISLCGSSQKQQTSVYKSHQTSLSVSTILQDLHISSVYQLSMSNNSIALTIPLIGVSKHPTSICLTNEV